MAKKDLDWGNLGFNYMPCDYSYVCNYKDGAWEEGGLTEDHTLTLSEDAGIFHYCQEIFEGLKAYTTEDGSIVCFRPDLNAQRMYDSAERLVMPPFPIDKFVDAVKQVVAANADWVPPFGSGATLYIRPFMVATGNVIGVKPADEYQFRIFVTPVGPYFKGGDTSVKLAIAKYDRAAPHGTGNIKAGLNYAMSLLAVTEAHNAGYAENMYLDSQSRTYVEDPYFEYKIDEEKCIGCGKCVKGCLSFGNGSLFLQVRRDLCKNCNECRIAKACPADAFVRVMAIR